MRRAVPADLDGERADKVVAVLGGLSRAAARALVDGGGVTVAGQPVDPTRRLAAGEEVEFEAPPAEPSLVPEDVRFAVRYEDADLVVVDKPAGVVVHPGAGVRSGTLAAGLLRAYPDLEGIGEEGRWGIVHRLDRDTSGLLVVARSARAHRALVAALARREVRRLYLALVHGRFDVPRGTVDAPIGVDPGRPTRRMLSPEGRPARTHFRRTAGWQAAGLSLVEVELETGRTHQIRVHLAAIGHPVVGDPVYGAPPFPGLGRTWLHAARLELDHPSTGARLVVESPLPPELAAVLDRLGPPDEGSPTPSYRTDAGTVRERS
jgi:23S rRNA pseudouridine1911/1915/1917 synthase